MSYKISIIEKRVLDEPEMAYQRVHDHSDNCTQGCDARQYDYVQVPGARKTVDVNRLTQEVGELDLAAVIRAVNGL